MINDLEEAYIKQEEPHRSCLFALRDIILELGPELTESLKYGMPFFSYKGKMFCYFWKDKKTKLPYVGVVKGSLINHPKLEQGNRSLIKIFCFDPNKDIPIKELTSVLHKAMSLYY
jgi:hypothetical protein